MKYIKFCKTYKNLENPDIKIILEKYAFILNLSKYSSHINGNSLFFKRFINLLTNIYSAQYLGGIILRSGTIIIFLEEDVLRICWEIPSFTIWFRIIFLGLIFSLPYYFMSTNKDINDAILLFISVFLFTSLISFIALIVKVKEINGSVL